MKKNLKRILVFVLAVMMLFSLCGCMALDEMRQAQAFYDESGSILWNGSTYKMLPACDYFTPECTYETWIYVTEADVPVLLSSLFNQEELVVCTDEAILSSYYTNSYYCREDLYDSVSTRIQQGFTPDVVCYSYSAYDEETDEYTTEYYTLTQEQIDVIELIISTEEPMTMGDGWYLDYAWSVYLEECSEDMLFRRNSLDISVSGDTYYLFLYTDQGELVYAVPDGCNAIFDEIVSAYKQSDDFYYSWDYGWDEATEATFAEEL